VAEIAEEVLQGSFEAGEAEVESAVAVEWVREGKGVRVPALCRLRDGGAAGIGESEEACAFIEGLARGVVARPAEELSGGMRGAEPEFRVSAGDGQCKNRELRN